MQTKTKQILIGILGILVLVGLVVIMIVFDIRLYG